MQPEHGNTGYLAFLHERIERGIMAPTVLNRVSRLCAKMDAGTKEAFLRPAEVTIPPLQGKLQVFAAPLGQANAFVLEHHRHHRPVVGHLFSIGVRDNVRVRGYAIVSRPVARHLDDGQTVEITRVVTDGSRNACSKLYGAVRRAVRQRNRELGQAVQRIITYTLSGEEDGASLRASGFKVDRVSAGGTWSRPSRHRQDTHPLSGKIRWVSVVE